MTIRKSRQYGFTLIELLVVIAIIAILAAILFPVFAKVREKARQTTCLSNEKEIGLATLEYVQDYEESYPLAQTPNFGYDWTVMVQPYIKNGTVNGGYSSVRGIFECPSFPLEPARGVDEQFQYHALDNVFGDYSHGPGDGKPSRPTSLSDIDHPSDQLMLFEGGLAGPNGAYYPPTDANPAHKAQGFHPAAYTAAWTGWMSNPGNTSMDTDQADLSDCDNFTNVGWINNQQYGPDVPGQMCGHFPRYRHNGFCNMLFTDGHAKAVRKGTLSWYNNIYIPTLTANSIWNEPE